MNQNRNDLDVIKEKLSKEKDKITNTLASLRMQDPYADPDRLIDNAASDTEANEESSHERFEALEKELKLHLDEINQAVERIEKNNYGKCMGCHKIIEIQRLVIKPTALYCMDCEMKKEK